MRSQAAGFPEDHRAFHVPPLQVRCSRTIPARCRYLAEQVQLRLRPGRGTGVQQVLRQVEDDLVARSSR